LIATDAKRRNVDPPETPRREKMNFPKVGLLPFLCLVACHPLPGSIFDTGLYQGTNKELAEGVIPYEPRSAFWSDGAEKTRFVFIPEGEKVDNTDPDNWVFPDGTKLWKEFKKDDVLVETRLIEKRDGEWLGAAYIWNEDGTEAQRAGDDGAESINGTDHFVPEQFTCKACHAHTGEWPLSFSALQLDHDGSPLTLADLDERGLLSKGAPESPLSFPGTEAEQAALAYLHVNCGNCHHEKLEKPAEGDFGPPEDLQFKMLVSELGGSVEDSALFKSTVGVEAKSENDVQGLTHRIVAGNAEESIVFQRMAIRDGDAEPSVQMPPSFGGRTVDDEGLEVIRAFIDAL
jgi:hypothetical protein